MWKLWSKSKSSSPVEVDFFNLCKQNVRSIEDLADDGNLLNKRQCQDLSTKLSKTILNIRELLSHCGYGASGDIFRPALENLYRYLENAKVLVSKCGEEDWCVAAVFQSQNENAFREILLEVGLCYNVIYEQAKSTSEDWNAHVEDLRASSVFLPVTASVVHEDQIELQTSLEDLANEPCRGNLLDHFQPDGLALKQCLARYLLLKLRYTAEQSEATTSDTCNAILWAKGSEPPGTWGDYCRFLEVGAGASRVQKTSWLGIPCARKEFFSVEAESTFLTEAGILANLKHPRIVNFICCGANIGEEPGDCFVAMELMEKSLFDLIEEQKPECFSLHVVVDLMVQMARGMCYLHDQGVAHCDFEPKNVVVNRLTSPHAADHFCVKLVDFGMSKTKMEISKFNTMSTVGIGTTRYRAPEVHPKAQFEAKGKFNTMSTMGIGTTRYRAPEVHPKAQFEGKGEVIWFKADVYSFAITCAHVLSLKRPFEEMEWLHDLYSELLNGRRPELPGGCPQELVALLRDCWNTNPRSRPSFMEICTRLENFRHKILRRYCTVDQDSEGGRIDFSAGFAFIKSKIEEQSSSHGGDSPELVPTRLMEGKTHCAQCDALAKVYHAGVERIFGLEPVVPWVLEATSLEQRNGAAESLSLLSYSLAEIERCVRSGIIYMASCTYPEFSSTDHSDYQKLSKMAFFLLRDFSFSLDLVQVAFNRFMFELKILDLSEILEQWEIIKDVADEFCKSQLFNLFEWCGSSCRPVLKQNYVKLVQRLAVAQQFIGLEWDLASPPMKVLEEPSAEPSDVVPRKIDYKDVEEGERLGHGGFGTVYKCKWHNKDRVVKIIMLSPELEEKFEMEVSILSSFRHPNAVQIFGSGYRKEQREGFIVMERMDMDLSTLIEEMIKRGNSNIFPFGVSLDMMFQIVEGMCYLRGKRVMHRDLKPANILVNRPEKGRKPFERFYHLKLADFGTSKVNEVNSKFSTIRVGTPPYMAPEVMAATAMDDETGNQGYSWKADVYSFGMVCSEILTGKRPFQHLHGHLAKTLAAIRAGKRPDLPLDGGHPLRRLIEDCWKFNPDARPDIQEVRQRLWECRVYSFKMEISPINWQTFRTKLESRFRAIMECQFQMDGPSNIIKD